MAKNIENAAVIVTTDGGAFAPQRGEAKDKNGNVIGVRVRAKNAGAKVRKANGREVTTVIVRTADVAAAAAAMYASIREADPKLAPERATVLAAQRIWHTGTFAVTTTGRGGATTDPDEVAVAMLARLGITLA